MNNKKDIALELKQYRKDAKKTQEEFGLSLGLTQGGYSDIERCKNGLSAKVKYMLQSIYNVNLDYLEDGVGERYNIKEEDPTEPGGKLYDKFYTDQERRINFQLQKELELAKKEIEYLNIILTAKEELIKALKENKTTS